MAPRFGCKTACRGAHERTYVTCDRQTEDLIEAVLWDDYIQTDASAECNDYVYRSFLRFVINQLLNHQVDQSSVV